MSRSSSTSGGGAIGFGVVVFLGVQALRILTGVAPGLDGTFDGADSYMRLVRVLECRGGAGCDGGLILRSNAPFGEVLHWPYLEDRLLLAGSLPLRAFLPFRESVIAIAYLWGPLLSIGVVTLLVAIGRRILERPALWLLGPLLATQLWALLAFAPHAVDHHGILVVLFLLAVVGALPVLTRQGDAERGALLTGIALGLGIWESVETFAAALPLVGTIGVLWILRGEMHLAGVHRRIFGAATMTLLVGLLIDGPLPDRLAAEYDRFSIVHVMLMALAAAFWVSVPLAQRWSTTPMRRTALAMLGLVAAGGITVLAFPDFARGPHAGVPADLFPTWIDPTVEFLPARSHAALWQVISLAPLLVCMPACIARARAGSPLWAFLAAALAWFGVLAAFEQIRWTYYLHALYPLPLAWLLWHGIGLARRAGPPLAVASAQVTLVLVFLSAPLLALLLLAEPAGARTRCEGNEILAALARAPADSSIVLADVFLGPEILYRTPHSVVATPYHDNVAGTRDSHAIMNATNADEARRLLDARGVRWIVACRGVAWYPLAEPDAPGTFYAALQRGTGPAWIRAVRLEAPLAQRVMLWRVQDLE